MDENIVNDLPGVEEDYKKSWEDLANEPKEAEKDHIEDDLEEQKIEDPKIVIKSVEVGTVKVDRTDAPAIQLEAVATAPAEEIPEKVPEFLEENTETPEESEEIEEPSKYNVWDLLARHEEFKKKGLQLTVDDLYNWICLQDEIIGVVSQMKAEYSEKKLEQDKEKAVRWIELKAEKDENGKTVNTDKMIEQLLKIEFSTQDLDQLVLKNTYELLQQRGNVITDLVNIVKLNMKTDFSI